MKLFLKTLKWKDVGSLTINKIQKNIKNKRSANSSLGALLRKTHAKFQRKINHARVGASNTFLF